jgi:hypothetical protein
MTKKRKINLTDRVAVIIDFLYLELDTDAVPLGGDFVGAFEDESQLDYVLECMKDGAMPII